MGGFTLWFTGLSGAGKSTIAGIVAERLRERGELVEVLDGDEVRENLSRGLGFSRVDRDTNIRRIGYVAKLLSRNGVVAITAAISPYREVRTEVRESIGRFVEAYVSTPLAVCIERDVKGLYSRALAGQLEDFTGISAPYEAPPEPEAVVRAYEEKPEESLGIVMGALSEHLKCAAEARTLTAVQD